MKINDLSTNHNAWLNETKLSKDLKEAYYDRNDYYDARQGGEYGKGMTYTRSGSSSVRGYDRDDALKGQTKHLPADPFNRTTGEIPNKSNKGKVHNIARPEEMEEGVEDSPVASAITRRILLQRHDLLSKYGPVAVTQAIDDVADFVGDVEEIGSSDVSGWIKQVEQSLASMGEGVAEAGPAQGEYSRVLTALRLYYPRFEMEELNTPEWYRVIANKANVTPAYAGQVIDDFVKASQPQPDEEENLDWMDGHGIQGARESTNEFRDEYNSFKG